MCVTMITDGHNGITISICNIIFLDVFLVNMLFTSLLCSVVLSPTMFNCASMEVQSREQSGFPVDEMRKVCPLLKILCVLSRLTPSVFKWKDKETFLRWIVGTSQLRMPALIQIEFSNVHEKGYRRRWRGNKVDLTGAS